MFRLLFCCMILVRCLGPVWSQDAEPTGTGYEILMGNVDDVAKVFINDQEVAENHWGKYYKTEGFNRPGYSGWINVDKHLKPGKNKIRFTLTNGDYPGGWGANFQMRYKGKVFFNYSDGRSDSSPGEKINIAFTLDTNTGPPAGLPVNEQPDLVVLSEGGADFDYAVVYQLMKQQYDFLVYYMGKKPTRPIVVHIGPDYGGMSNGFDMWMDSKRIYDTSHNYAHEMMHCFCRDYGAFPNWMFEQLADIAYCESEVYLWKRRNENAFKQQWVNERSGQLVSLRIIYGPRFYPDFFKLVHQDLVSGNYKVRTDSTEHLNKYMTDYFNRAAGENAVAHLQKKGFRMEQE